MEGGVHFHALHEQAADRVAFAMGIEQPPHLVAIPHVTPLKLWQGRVAAVDMVEDG